MYYGYGFGFNYVSRGLALDPDAQAFITAASITDHTQQSAVNQLVVDLKAASLWTDIDSAFPFIGGSATSHRYNLKTATADITWSGGITHNANGVTFNGSTGYGNSGWAVSAGNLYNRHYSQYVRSMASASAWSGKFDGTRVFGMQLQTATTLIQVGCNNLPLTFSQPISANTVTCVVVESNTSGKVYNNGSLVHTTPDPIGAGPTSGNMYIGALAMADNSASFYQPSNLGFVTYGKALNATKQSALNTAIKNFNTAIGR